MTTNAGTPPAGTPPAGTPPAGTPPAGTPPTGTPPAGTPPAGTPPAGTPPAGTPPAEYAAFTLPEGVKLEGEMLTEFTTFAKGLGLSQEAAQKFVEREVALQQAADKDLAAQVTKQKAEWETQARSDAEIGGAKYDENLGIANKALDQFGSPALRDMLKTTPFGQHPDVLRFLVKVGQAISQDNFVPAGGAPPAPKRFYTNSQHAA